MVVIRNSSKRIIQVIIFEIVLILAIIIAAFKAISEELLEVQQMLSQLKAPFLLPRVS